MVLALVVAQSFVAICHTLHTFLCLIISKISRGKSSLSSILPPRCGNIVALLYKKLDIHSQSVLKSYRNLASLPYLEELPVLEEPTQPSVTTVNPGKSKVTELDADGEKELAIQQIDYKSDVSTFKKQESAIDALRFQIQSTVSRTYLIHTFKCNTTYDMLAPLKQRVLWLTTPESFKSPPNIHG
jgi:hypothetical protein